MHCSALQCTQGRTRQCTRRLTTGCGPPAARVWTPACAAASARLAGGETVILLLHFPLPFSWRFDKDDEGVPAKWQSR